MTISEEWRTIQEFPGYEVSSLGRIRNRETGNIRKCSPNGKNGEGYLQTNFCVGNIRYRRAVHILVARAFLGEPTPEAPLVLHWNGNKQHNQVSNLYYGTALDNMEDCRRHGIKVGRPKGT